MEPTMAADLARRISARLPEEEWALVSLGDGHWHWVYADEDYPQTITVDGREDRTFIPINEAHAGRHLGPTIEAFRDDMSLRIETPNMTDLSDQRQILAVLEAFGVLAGEETHV